MVGIPAPSRTAFAYGTRYPGSGRTDARPEGPTIPPDEQSTRSTPACFSPRASSIVSSSVTPPSMPSTTDVRYSNGIPDGITARTASATASGKRIRDCRSPPHSSSLWLAIGEKKLFTR